MWNKTRLLCLCFCSFCFTACTSYGPSNNDSIYQYSSVSTPIYLEDYSDNGYYSDESQSKKEIVVPDSYHVGMNHAPSSHTDRDKEWVNNQSAESYTIELADGDQAAEVAKTLYKAPKKERMAEIKYQRAGKTYYKGLYGTYPNYEAAQEALKSLPEDMKQKAGVKPWSSIQRSVND
jgi:septal ring-binding cell division protein DamX